MGVAAGDPVDPTIYRVEDDVGEHEIQTYILEVLRPLVERYLRERGVEAHVGSDQFIYWRQYEPQACVAPDLYILPGVPQEIAIAAWKVWEHGIVPDFALEVVGSDARKDYEDAPRRYAELGVQELVVFDPFPAAGAPAFTVFRRNDTGLYRAESTGGDRVLSARLGCFLRRVGESASLRLRLGTGPEGNTLYPTAVEAAGAAVEAEREAREAEREAREAERKARKAAEARVAELEAELARRRG